MQEPSGAQYLEFAKWYRQVKVDVSEATAQIIWDAAWDLAVESTFISLGDYILTPKGEDLFRHVNNMIGHYMRIRANRRGKLTAK
jgi:hypothetical protein